MKANKNRLVEEFFELATIDSESYCERQMADRLRRKLEALGFTVEEDDAGTKIGGNAGNLYGILKGDPNQTSILLSAHMDTVKPGIGKVPIMDQDGKITSQGDTVLGSDDLSGVVEILEGIRLAQASGESLGDIEVLFTVCEEVYGKGASNFDYSKIGSKIAYALDLSGSTGQAAIKAPSIISFEANIVGKAAHSGFEPEKGVNAIKAATEAIHKIRQGYVGDMTVNIGTVKGGAQNNIVSESCIVTGEVRGFDHQEALDEIHRIEDIFWTEIQNLWKEYGEIPSKEDIFGFSHEVNIKAFDIPEDSYVCERFVKACKDLGLAGDLVSTHGGSDNADFVDNGIDGIVLSCGMNNVHSVNEYCYVEDLEKGAELVAGLLIGQ